MRGRTILVADLVTVGLAVGSVAHVDGADDLVRTHLLGSSLALLESDRPLEGLTVLQRLDLGMASDDGIGTVLTKHSLVIALADLVSDFCRVSVGIGNPEGSGRGNGGSVYDAVPPGEFTLVHAVVLVELPRLPQVFDILE